MKEHNAPLISIVTIVYNNVNAIEKTISSIINQTYEKFEYIVIDGGSTDGTVDIIKKYENRISYWVSEPDKGIYDAINKGIEKSAGEWICFINSGDRLYNRDVISDIFSHDYSEDVLYGDTMMHYNYGNIILAPHKFELIEKHMIFAHPSSFTRTAIAKEIKYDLKYKIAADDNFFYKLYVKGCTFKYIPICISYFDRTDKGISKSNIKLARMESDKIRGKNIDFKWHISFYANYFRSGIKKILRSLLPHTFVMKRQQRLLSQNFRIKKMEFFRFKIK